MHVSLITSNHDRRLGEPHTLPVGPPGEEYAHIARRAAGGALWVLIAYAAGRVLGFGTNIVLARLLTPSDFGLVSFCMVLIGAFLLLQDLGVGPALVYTRRDIAAAGGTALLLNLATATGLFLLTLVGSAIYRIFGQAETIPIVLVCLAFGLIIIAAGSVQSALLTKQLAFRQKLIPDVLPLIISGCVSIVLALLGAGVWSLVAGYLAKNLATTLLLWYLSPVRPRLSFNWTIARELLGYGRHVSLSAVVGFAVMNIDYLIVGHLLGARPLGLYTLAFMIGTLPSTLIGQQIATAIFPAYARIRHSPDDLRRLFGTVFAGTTALSVALGAAVFVGAPTIVGPLLGDDWLGIGPTVQVLAIFGTLRAIEFTFSPLYRAMGRPEIMWASSLLRLITLAPLLLIAAEHNVERVALVQAFVGALFVPLNGLILMRLLNLSLDAVLRLIAPQLTGVAVIAAIIAAAQMQPSASTFIQQPLGATLIVGVAILVQLAIVAACSPALVAPARAAVLGWWTARRAA